MRREKSREGFSLRHNISLWFPRKLSLKQRKERKIARDDFQLFMAIEHKHIPYQLQYIMTTTQDEPRR